jgi:uncharacterized protein YukE
MPRYDMGQGTLSGLRQQTGASNQDLGALVKRLVVAAAPLEGRFNGAGKAAFDNFKLHADQISANLNNALASILHGQAGMDTAFRQGEQTMVEQTRSSQGAADVGAASVSGKA